MKCPECGAELIKKPKYGTYECPNPNCPVIKVRVHGKGKWIGEIIVHYDSRWKMFEETKYEVVSESRKRSNS